jgi:hypothetical protein
MFLRAASGVAVLLIGLVIDLGVPSGQVGAELPASTHTTLSAPILSASVLSGSQSAAVADAG